MRESASNHHYCSNPTAIISASRQLRLVIEARQVQTGQCPAGKRRGNLEEQTDANIRNSFQIQGCETHTHTHQRQRPFQCCRGAWEGGQQSDYSPLTSEPGRHPDPRGRSDPPELRTDPRAAPPPLQTHTHPGRQKAFCSDPEARPRFSGSSPMLC